LDTETIFAEAAGVLARSTTTSFVPGIELSTVGGSVVVLVVVLVLVLVVDAIVAVLVVVLVTVVVANAPPS
jgi:hypothetical protein